MGNWSSTWRLLNISPNALIWTEYIRVCLKWLCETQGVKKLKKIPDLFLTQTQVSLSYVSNGPAVLLISSCLTQSAVNNSKQPAGGTVGLQRWTEIAITSNGRCLKQSKQTQVMITEMTPSTRWLMANKEECVYFWDINSLDILNISSSSVFSPFFSVLSHTLLLLSCCSLPLISAHLSTLERKERPFSLVRLS